MTQIRPVVTAFQEVQGWDKLITYKSKEQALEEYRTTMSYRNVSDAVSALMARIQPCISCDQTQGS